MTNNNDVTQAQHPAMRHLSGKQLSKVVAAMTALPDRLYFGLPEALRDLNDLLCTLVVDERMDDGQAAQAAGVPQSVVVAYRKATLV